LRNVWSAKHQLLRSSSPFHQASHHHCFSSLNLAGNSRWLVALANWTGLSDLLDSAKELFGITASTLTFSSRPLPPPALGERRHGGLAARLIPVRRPTVFVVAKYGIRSWRMKSSSGHAGRKRSNCAVAKIEELARRVANLQADAEVKALRDEVERLQAELAKRPSP